MLMFAFIRMNGSKQAISNADNGNHNATGNTTENNKGNCCTFRDAAIALARGEVVHAFTSDHPSKGPVPTRGERKSGRPT